MERQNEAARMLRYFEKGENRAQAGRPIVVDAVRGIRNPVEATTYVMGYMKSVTAVLNDIGISDPQDIGIHESFMHIVVQDPKMEGTCGIEGMSDGSMAIAGREEEYGHLGQSPLSHYKDGYKIGLAFAQANVRQGKFAAIANVQAIPEGVQQQLLPEIQLWLASQGITQVKPEIVLSLHPVAREVFAYVVENGDNGFDMFYRNMIERVIKNPHFDNAKKAEIIGGIGKTAKFARRIREVKSL